MRAATADITTPLPPPPPFPPGCLKLALFLPIAPFFLFFNLPQKEVGREIEGRRGGGEKRGGRGGVKFPTPGSAF